MKRELVRQGRMVSRNDQKHLAELDQELDLAEVIAAGVVMSSTGGLRAGHDGCRLKRCSSNRRLPASAASGEPRR
jgi:hypothetical protein